MDVDRGLVSAMLRDGKLSFLRTKDRIPPEFLKGDGRVLYEKMLDYWNRYRKIPSVEILESETSLAVIDPQSLHDTPMEYYVDTIKNRQILDYLKSNAKSFMSAIEGDDSSFAISELEKITKATQKINTAAVRVDSYAVVMHEVDQWYKDVAAGKRGIMTPWKTFNELTFGLWPEDFFLLVARPGKHKTFLLLAMSEYARVEQNKRVLVFSTEMSKLKMGTRVGAMNMKLSYHDVTHGSLGTADRERFEQALHDEERWKNGFIVGGDFDFQLESIESIIEEIEPDSAWIDGVSLVKAAGIHPSAKEADRVAVVMDEVKKIAKRKGIPITCTMHLNRESTKNQKEGELPGLEHISFSDAAGRNADGVIAVHQTPDLYADQKLLLCPLKLREAKKPEPITINCRLREMDFSEASSDGSYTSPEHQQKSDKAKKSSGSFDKHAPNSYSDSDEEVPF